MMSEGQSFESFLGKGSFEEIMSKYDEFLHESFGERPIDFTALTA